MFVSALVRSSGTVRVNLAAVRNLHLDLGLPDTTADAALLPRVTKGIRRAGLPGSVVHGCQSPPWLFASWSMCCWGRTSQSLTVSCCTLPCSWRSTFACDAGSLPRLLTMITGGFASRGDVMMDSDGMQFRLKTSKTDPYGKGTTIEVGLCKPPMCTILAIRTYLTTTSGAPHDPLFEYKDGRPLSKKTFVYEVRRLLESPSIGNALSYSGHSFQIGAATSAAMAGAPDWQIRAMGRWKSDFVIRYIRHDSSPMKGLAKLLTSSLSD